MSESATAIVTGASGGIGAAIAKAMLEQGYRVVSLALEKPDWSHKHLESRAVDLLDAKATKAAAAEIVRAHRVTHIVHNAGVIKPNPVAFGGVSGNSSKTLQVIVFNEGATDAQPRIFISSGAPQFKIKEGTTVTCPRIHHGQRCTVHVTYHPSSASQDSGTIRAADKLRFTNRATAQLTGHRTVPHPPNCIMAMKRHQKIIKQVKKNGKKVLKRTPFALSLTQSQDGRVSAIASALCGTLEGM